jgi:hypothetical protein
MDPLTRLMGRTSLMYLASGFILGAVLLIAEATGASWGGAWGTTHAHIMFVGWFVQFAIGIGFWLLPRRKTPERPYGYNPTPAYIAYGLLNTGLVLRILVEPIYQMGNLSGNIVVIGLAISGVLQGIAGVIWASQLWGRFYLRYTATNRPVKSEKE